MTDSNRIEFRRLRVDGPGKKPAEVSFGSGLNGIIGASDTGKSYIFESINFMLGGDEPPDPNPFSNGYDRCSLEIRFGDGRLLTIRRKFGDSEVDLFDSSIDEANHDTFIKRISAGHITRSKETLSFELLDAIGISEKSVRSDATGKTQAVTIRSLTHVTLVDENRIITKISPALTGQRLSITPERAFLRYLLSGEDDSHLPQPIQKKNVRDANFDGQIVILENLIKQRERKLSRLVPDTTDIDERLLKVQETINTGISWLTSSAETISKLEEARQAAWNEIERIRDRRLVLAEQSKRLVLLRDYYVSDANRLEAVIEAGAAFERLPTGECAVCGSVPDFNDSASVDRALENFKTACSAELGKILVLSGDLNSTLKDFEFEEGTLALEEEDRYVEWKSINFELQEKLQPQRAIASSSFQELLKLKADLTKAVDFKLEISSLRKQLEKVEAAKKIKIATSVFTDGVTAESAQPWCDEIERTLRAWKYNFHGRVTFDPKKFDIVVGTQARGSMGKGYRAITHAACVVGLMRYCRSKKLPHPGFVVIDSPLNPFREKIDPEASTAISSDVKAAFYRDLAADRSGNQYVIIENTEPPPELHSQMHYEQFTANSEVGRAGFFPPASLEADQATLPFSI